MRCHNGMFPPPPINLAVVITTCDGTYLGTLEKMLEVCPTSIHILRVDR